MANILFCQIVVSTSRVEAEFFWEVIHAITHQMLETWFSTLRCRSVTGNGIHRNHVVLMFPRLFHRVKKQHPSSRRNYENFTHCMCMFSMLTNASAVVLILCNTYVCSLHAQLYFYDYLTVSFAVVLLYRQSSSKILFHLSRRTVIDCKINELMCMRIFNRPLLVEDC